MALHFEQVSLAALPANLLAAAAIAPVMWLGMLAAAAAQIAPGAGAAVQRRSTRRCWRSSSGSRTRSRRRPRRSCRCGSARRPRWPAPTPRSAAAIARRRGAALAARRRRIEPRRGRRRGRGARGGRAHRRSRCAAALDDGPSRRPRRGELVVSFLDVGQGDATLLQKDGVAVLVDTGPPGGPILRRLSEAGVERLDALVITHAQSDHEGAALEVLRRVPDAAGGQRRRRLADARAGRPGRRHQRAADRRPRRPGAHARRDPHAAAVAAAARRPASGPRATPTTAPSSPTCRSGDFDLLLPADAESDVTAALELPRRRGAQGRPPRQRRRGPAGAARAHPPRVRRDRGRPRQHVRPPGAVDARGAARRRPRLPHRPRRHGPPPRPTADAVTGRRTRLAQPCPASRPPTSSTATTTAGSASAARSCGRWPRPRAARAASSCSRATRAPPRRWPAR